MQIEVVLEIGGRHGCAEVEDSEPLECERAGDDTSAECVRVELGTGDDDRWPSRLLRDRAKSHDEFVDRRTRGMLVGNAEVSGRPAKTELGLNGTEHIDCDVVERHAVGEELGCEPIGEADVAVDESGQHRETLDGVSAWGELGTHLDRPPCPFVVEPTRPTSGGGAVSTACAPLGLRCCDGDG